MGTAFLSFRDRREVSAWRPPTSLPACGGACNKLSKGPEKRAFPDLLLPSCGGRGIRTPGTLPFNSFQDCRHRPLGHSSISVVLRRCRKYSQNQLFAKIFASVAVKYLTNNELIDGGVPLNGTPQTLKSFCYRSLAATADGGWIRVSVVTSVAESPGARDVSKPQIHRPGLGTSAAESGEA